MSSTTCIELSSDEECEIIGTSTQVNKKVEPPPKHSLNVKKLSRNLNIELTINLEDNPNESSKRSSVNGSIVVNKASTSHLNNKNGHVKENPITTERRIFSNVENEKRISEPNIKQRISEPSIKQRISDPSVKKQIPKPDVKKPASEPDKRNQIAEPTLKKRVIPEIVIIDDDTPAKEQTSAQVNGLKSFFGHQHLQQTRKSPQKEGTSFSPANKKKSEEVLDCDVVVIDDDEDDEPRGAKPSLPSKINNKFNNQQLNSSPMRFKDKINNQIRERLTANKRETSSKQNGQGAVGKRRSCPENIPVIPDYPDSESRITRGFLSSLNNPSQKPEPTPKPKMIKKNEPGTSNIQTMNKYSIENMFSGLVKVCNKIFTDDKLETKLWNSFRQASEDVLRSEEFINALKVALNSSEKSKIETLDEKLAVSRDVKEVIRILKRNPVVVDRKVKKLTKMLNIIRGRIKKLEETEVTSDEDGEENPYVLLDRYRARAAKIFDKICELQGESSHAGRAVRQRFSFTGSSGYPKIEQALQKYYLKTQLFPDFFEVKKLVETTAKKENLDLPPGKIYSTAQSLFLEFGNRLQRMRCFDEYSIMNEYLEDGKTKDPALDNEPLHRALAQWDSTKRILEGEKKILEEFTCKQMENKSKDNKSDESGNEGSGKDNDDSDEEVEKHESEKELHLSDTDEELINSDVKNKPEQSEDDDEEPPPKVAKL